LFVSKGYSYKFAGRKTIEEFKRQNPSVPYSWQTIKTKVMNEQNKRKREAEKELAQLRETD
jgi:hypothetical protein